MEGGIEPDEVSVLQPARRVWETKTQKLGIGETQQIASCGLEIGTELEDGAVQLEEELEELTIEAGVVVLVLEGEERVQQRLGDVVPLPVKS